MADKYDVVVLGLGGVGSSSLAYLALRNSRVLGIEQFGPGHDMGASHGFSRIFRWADIEKDHSLYWPLTVRSYELWRAMEKRSSRILFQKTGGLVMASEGDSILDAHIDNHFYHKKPSQILNAQEIKRKFPVFNPQPKDIGIYEEDAGLIMSNESIIAHLNVAMGFGAEAWFGVKVHNWELTADGRVGIETSRGKITAEKLIICAGPWFGQMVSDLAIPMRVERRVMYWFNNPGPLENFGPGALPVTRLRREVTIGVFPMIEGYGLKAQMSGYGKLPSVLSNPSEVSHEVTEEEKRAIECEAAHWMPSGSWQVNSASVAMDIYTADRHFVIGPHPRYPQILLAGGFSGHGFKYFSAIGESLAQLAIDGTMHEDCQHFSANRLFSAA